MVTIMTIMTIVTVGAETLREASHWWCLSPSFIEIITGL
jgi:hypothetical protein